MTKRILVGVLFILLVVLSPPEKTGWCERAQKEGGLQWWDIPGDRSSLGTLSQDNAL